MKGRIAKKIHGVALTDGGITRNWKLDTVKRAYNIRFRGLAMECRSIVRCDATDTILVTIAVTKYVADLLATHSLLNLLTNDDWDEIEQYGTTPNEVLGS
jgi:hypothetical protein